MSLKLKSIDSNEIQKLLTFRPSYKIRQINGERVYGPPVDGSMKKPAEGSEIYVYRIPYDCAEDELVPFFEMIAPIYELRIKINFSGSGRGYAFVKYSDPFEAEKAVRILNNFTIRLGSRMKVIISFDNKRLRIENIPKMRINNVMAIISKGITHMNYKPMDGVLTLKYKSHHWASMARREFYQSDFKLKFAMEWSSPKEQQEEVTALWIRNFALPISAEKMIPMFSFGKTIAKSVKNIDGLILVVYETRKDAEFAYNKLSLLIDRLRFEMCWAMK